MAKNAGQKPGWQWKKKTGSNSKNKKTLGHRAKDAPGGTRATAQTTVDLGEDLLTRTGTLASVTSDTPTSIDVQFENARILVNEGLIDDAKKLLRKILIQDAMHAPARASLQEILDKELKDLLSEEATDLPRRRVSDQVDGKGRRQRRSHVSSEQLLAAIDHEFGLGILDPLQEDKWVSKPRKSENLSVDDYIDVAVAFMEIGAYSSAIERLRAAIDLLAEQPLVDRHRLVSASALLAETLIRCKQPFEAMQIVHPILRDPHVSTEEKTEFFYLMGAAQEMAKGRRSALPWFAKVFEIDPHYRNISDKFRKPGEK